MRQHGAFPSSGSGEGRYDLLIAGIGIGGPKQCTVATLAALRRARVVFNLSIHEDFVRGVCRRVVDLRDDYHLERLDGSVYRDLADRVLQEVERGPRVATIDDGHPFFYDDVARDLERRGRRRGFDVRVLPAISSFDTLLAERRLPFAGLGLQVIEANDLVGCRVRLNPHLDTLVLQIGWYGTSLLTPIRGHRPERFLPLRNHLLRFYPPEHRVRIARSSQDRGQSAVAAAVRLGRLERSYRRIDIDSTLYVPALTDGPGYSDRAVAQLEDPAHLRRIAYVDD